MSNNIYMTVKIVLAASKYSNKIFMSGCKTSTTLWHRPQAGAVTVIFCLSLSTGGLLKTDQCSYIIIAECPKIKGQNNSQMCKVVCLIKTNNITSVKFYISSRQRKFDKCVTQQRWLQITLSGIDRIHHELYLKDISQFIIKY